MYKYKYKFIYILYAFKYIHMNTHSDTQLNICTSYHMPVLKKRLGERGGRGGGRRRGGIIRLGEGNWFEESQE